MGKNPKQGKPYKRTPVTLFLCDKMAGPPLAEGASSQALPVGALPLPKQQRDKGAAMFSLLICDLLGSADHDGLLLLRPAA